MSACGGAIFDFAGDVLANFRELAELGREARIGRLGRTLVELYRLFPPKRRIIHGVLPNLRYQRKHNMDR